MMKRPDPAPRGSGLTPGILTRGYPLDRRRFMRLCLAMGLSVGAAQVLSACGGSSAEDESVDSLTIFSFGGTMPDVLKSHASAPFSNEHSDLAVNVEVGTNAATYPKMLSAKSSPTINGGMFNDTYDQKGIVDNLWAPFDMKLMTNAGKVMSELNPPGGGLAMAVQGGGIAYNPTKIDKPASWKDLYNPEFKGRVGMPKGNYDQFLMATMIAGGNTQDINRGIAEWEQHKDNIALWTDSPTQQLELLHKGDVWLSPMFSSPVITAKKQGQDVDFSIPEEGASQNTQILRVVSGFPSQAIELTQQYLNYFYTPEFQEALISERNVSPAVSGIQVPEELRASGLLTAEEAVDQLIRFDWAWLAANLTDVEEEVQKRLRG